MTDNEIIKALECMLGLCNNDMAYVLDCRGCAFECNQPCDERCSDGIAKAALSLINRQKAEIERLENKVEELSEVLSDTIRIRYAECKAEAIKEFAERLKDVFNQYDVELFCQTVIDNLVKEMVGDDK